MNEPNYDGSKVNRLKEGLTDCYMNANGSKELMNLFHIKKIKAGENDTKQKSPL